MYQLYFERSNGEIQPVARAPDEKSVWPAIRDDIARRNPNFVVHYIRNWVVNRNGEPATMFDVGSHTEFYYCVPPLPPEEEST